LDTAVKVMLETPARQPPTRDSFNWRPRPLEDWLQNLPVANLGETSRQVYEALRSVNRMEIPPAERLTFMLQLRDIVAYVSEGLRKHYLGRELPLRNKPRTVATLAILLLQEMALGFEIAAQDLNGRRRLATALHQALLFRGRVLLEHWIVYLSPPQGSWRRLHELYRLAEQQGIADERARFAGAGRHESPAAAYKLAILVAAAGPSRMPPGDILDSWRLLRHWAHSARLGEASAGDDDIAAFRIPRSADAPPHATVTDLNRDDDRLLDTSELLRLIEREFATTVRPRAFWRRQPLADVSPELVNRVLLALGAVPSRQHPRMRARARVQVAVGLTRLHRILNRELGRDERELDDAGRHFQAREPSRPGVGDTDVWDLVYPAELLRTLARDSAASRLPEPPRHEELQDWNLVNISRGGYCLLSGSPEVSRVQVGELILLREVAGRDLPWQLGAIRWLRAIRDQGLQLGVEILAPSPIPVHMRAQHDDGHFGPVERGLMLPAVDATEQPPSLIAPGPHYVSDRRVQVRHGNKNIDLTLGRVFDNTTHYLQFEFRQSGPPETGVPWPDSDD
jgi:hypothetical protein